MSTQKIIGVVLILVIFAAMIVLGIRGLPKQGTPEAVSSPPEAEGLPAGTSVEQPFAEPSEEPSPEPVEGPAAELPAPALPIEDPLAGAVIPGEAIEPPQPIIEPVAEPTMEPLAPSEPEGFFEDPLAGAVPAEEPIIEPGEPTAPMTEPIVEEPEIPSWQNPEEPTQSAPLTEGQVVEGAIEIEISAEGISPSSFEVERGETVFLSVSSSDQWTHLFQFKDESLDEVAVGLGPGQTRVITFYAPDEKGDYEYYCGVPGHEGRGEKGTMTVK